MEQTEKIGIIILAGGKGTRMNAGEIPKVLVPLYGKPLISHLLHSIESVHADPRPIIVVGYQAEMVKSALGSQYQYVVQEPQLGTGHAVMQARTLAEGKYDHVVVLYGDHPHVSADVINKMIATHLSEHATLTLATAVTPDFNEWRAGLFSYGRVVRDAACNIARIVEKKDASSEELEIKELNPAYYCFRAEWLWENLSKLENKNAQSEYYLTDMLSMAIADGEKISSFECDLLSALGVNTREELETMEKLIQRG